MMAIRHDHAHRAPVALGAVLTELTEDREHGQAEQEHRGDRADDKQRPSASRSDIPGRLILGDPLNVAPQFAFHRKLVRR
jgi:hypothetical protein